MIGILFEPISQVFRDYVIICLVISICIIVIYWALIELKGCVNAV